MVSSCYRAPHATIAGLPWAVAHFELSPVVITLMGAHLAASFEQPNSLDCAALGTAGVSCTSGLEHVNTVNATVIDDAGEGHTVTGSTASTLTVDACFTSHN